MQFDHICLVVSDLDEALQLWRDMFDFRVMYRMVIPDGREPGPDVMIPATLLDDVFKVKDARSEMAMLVSDEGSLIELQCCQHPHVTKTPVETMRYGNTGIRELALRVVDIDSWFARIRAAGYVTQTEYVWPFGTRGRTFLFEDSDANLIQLVERPVGWTPPIIAAEAE